MRAKPSSFALSFLVWTLIGGGLTACQQKTTNSEPAASPAPKTAQTTAAHSPNAVSQPAQHTNTSSVVYRVGIDPVHPPFVQRDGKGNFEGFDIEILNEIAKREGFQVQYQSKTWTGIFNLLDTHELDIVVGGAVATDERREKWALTEPHYHVSTVLLVSKDSAIQKFTDGKGKKIAYSKGGSVLKDLQTLQGRADLDPSLAVDTTWLRVKSVLNHKAEAAIGTSATLEYYAKQYKDFGMRVVYPQNPELSDVVFAVRKNDHELLAKLNKGLAALKQEGLIEQYENKWLKSSSNQ